VTAEPEEQGPTAPAGHLPAARAAAPAGHLRTSRADREQVIDVLKTAFVQGRMRKDEFDARVDRTFASRTYAELAAITADIPAGIPAGPSGDQPPRPGAQVQARTPTQAQKPAPTQARTPAPTQARTPVSHATKARRFMIIGVAMLVLFVLSRGASGLLFGPLALTAFVLAGVQKLAARRERRGQLPGSAAPCQAPPTGQPAGDG
jgi:Domain of unknown function (DUF1707)